MEVPGRCADHGLPRYVNGQVYPPYTTDVEIAIIAALPPPVKHATHALLNNNVSCAAEHNTCANECVTDECHARCEHEHTGCGVVVDYTQGVNNPVISGNVVLNMLSIVISMAGAGLIGAGLINNGLIHDGCGGICGPTECCCRDAIGASTCNCYSRRSGLDATCEDVCDRHGRGCELKAPF